MNRAVRFSIGLVIVITCVIGSAQQAHATTIGYEAINLVDTAKGQDLWMYKYFVGDAKFQADQGFTVFFDLGLYSDIAVSPKSAGPDWDPIAIQPDETLSSDGYFDALALVKGASLSSPFIVTFNWLGGTGTAPGSQQFEVYNNTVPLDVFETGSTKPVRPSHQVPEPSTLLLSGLGLALATRFRRTRA